jgi:hypothetical protein
MLSPLVLAQANAVLKRGMAVRWRDLRVRTSRHSTPTCKPKRNPTLCTRIYDALPGGPRVTAACACSS